MPRVASLYLPTLATDRLRPSERNDARRDPVRTGQGQAAAASPLVLLLPPVDARGEGPAGTRIADCSCPRGGGWRPGARWAENGKERRKREALQAEIDALPHHQRPPLRELGRRSEPAPVIFRRSPPGLIPGADAVGGADSPLVTVHRVGNRIVLAALSAEAAALGLNAGMALTQARALVPGLDVRDADPVADQALLTRLALLAARRWTPRAAVSDESGLFLDLTGTSHLFGGEEALCRRVLALCGRSGFAARIAVAGTPGAAHALARHGGSPLLIVPSGTEAVRLGPLPLTALRLSEEALGAARRLGLATIGDLLAKPRAPLQRRFGSTLLRRLDQALGRAGEALAPVVPTEPPAVLLSFLEPIATAEAITEAIGEAMRRLAALLEQEGLGIRRLRLACTRVDGAVQTIAIGTVRATRDRPHLLRLLCARIESIEPGFGIEHIRLTAARVEPLAAQPIAGDLAGEPLPPDLAELIDRLAGRLGARRLFRMTSFESDVPERSTRAAAPLESPAAWPNWPRPVRLLSPPERVDNVLALLPDQPPRRFTWRGQRVDVAHADGPERIHGEWWRARGEADAVRDYFQVEDAAGRRFWLYRRGDGLDPRTGDLSWHIQGAFA